MKNYRAPVRDMRFILHELLGAEREFAQLSGLEETTADVMDAVLGEAARLSEEVIEPTNQPGDREGCRKANGQVRTPAGFKEAYQAMAQGGWLSLAGDPRYGGQGLPETLFFCLDEMLCSANVALNLYGGLTHAARITLGKHGTEDLKRLYLPNLMAGRWSGTMCLTESHCGTDLGLVRTRAVPGDDGSYRITGTKIFVTGGEHDLTENIIHMVLARLPDAPPGTKGLTMFLVPKYLLDEEGSLAARNAVRCATLEQKMGLRGSATCVLDFDDATGYLVGEAHQGLRSMFTMMNRERLAIGIQGLGLAEAAYQQAAAYAFHREQGRAPGGAKYPGRPADAIIVHPDVRRMLLTVRAYNEGARALAAWIALKIDIAERNADAAVREEAEDLIALLTPVVKAFFTDTGFECCNLCLQVFGGHGYISESGVEQRVRDARIAQIYEGTNGVQAMDLVARKLPMHGGRLVKRLFRIMERFLEEHRDNADLEEFIAPLAQAFAALQDATHWLNTAAAKDPAVPGACAADYLRLVALVTLGFLWASMAKAALAKAGANDKGFYAAKLATARFFMYRLLPQTGALRQIVVSGSRPVMEMEEAAFSPLQ